MIKSSIFFPGDSPLINARTVLYFEKEEHPLLNDVLSQHFESFKTHCESHGFTFIYLPGTKHLQIEALDRLSNQLQYLYPRYFNLREKGLYQLVRMLFEHYPGHRIYKRLTELLGRLDYPDAGFLIFDEEMSLLGKPQYRTLNYTWIEQKAKEQQDPSQYLLKRLLNFFINELSPVRIRKQSISLYESFDVISDQASYSLPPKVGLPRISTPEDRFQEESAKVTRELRDKLSKMLAPGQEAILMNVLMDFMATLKKDNPKVAWLLESELNIKLQPKNQALSPLKLVQISGGYDFRILLPDYDLEIQMTPLCKTLYLFFLRHPDGVMLKDLVDHRAELMKIYERISNLGDKEKIEDNIDRLVDVVRDNSIHVNCARIKSAFGEKVTDPIARRYYITGRRGQPKRIDLKPGLIQIDPFLMNW